MTDLDHIEALVGPLPRGREYAEHDKTGDEPGWDDEWIYRAKSLADAALAEAYERLDHALSWDGVEEFIDRTYPPHIFTGVSGDPGPRILVLLRELKKAEAEVERLDKLGPVSRRQWMMATDDLSALKAEVEKLKWMLDRALADLYEGTLEYDEYKADLAARYKERP